MVDLTGYRLTFDDEFNKRSISQIGTGTTWADIRSEWRFDANSDIGFGHSSFVDAASGYDPFSVRNGALTITAVPDQTKFGYPGSWESGLITTQGNFSQTYGYFEMRANLSSSIGAWDAFWLLPNQAASNPNHLPGWQELDVVEHYGSNEGGVYSALHTTDSTPSQNLQYYSSHPGLTSGYHTYGVNWQADKISFYFDGKYMGYQLTPSDMHGPMYILANLATQGSGGNNADAAGKPISMSIDYIRAYSNDPNAVAVVHDTVSAPDNADPGLYGATSAVVASSSTVLPSTSTTATPGASASTPIATSLGSGSDKLVLRISEDAYKGDAQYTVSVDGKQIGGTLTAHASHAANQSDTVTLSGDWATGDHKVSINFLNDAYDGTASTDRNLYLDGATYNGADVSGSKIALASAGAQTVTVHDTTAVPTASGSSTSGSQTSSLGGSTTSLTQSTSATSNSIETKPDVSATIDLHGSAAQAYRLYQAALDRAPDSGGLSAHTDALQHGLSLHDDALSFINSVEFGVKFGTNTSDQAFVTALYNNVLDRAPDAVGNVNWLNALTNHTLDRASVLIGFSESLENHAKVDPAITAGIHLDYGLFS